MYRKRTRFALCFVNYEGSVIREFGVRWLRVIDSDKVWGIFLLGWETIYCERIVGKIFPR